MNKLNANYIHYSNWFVPQDYKEPVVVLVTWWEPEPDSETFFHENAEEALKAISSPEFNQDFMTELENEWEVHDDIVIRVMAY